jgi:multiple sugar transport system permease protein
LTARGPASRATPASSLPPGDAMRHDSSTPLSDWADRQAPRLMLGPALVLLLAFAIFPTIASAWLALSRFRLTPEGFELRFVGTRNFDKLLTGSEQFHFLGTFGDPGLVGTVLVAVTLIGGLALIARGLVSRRFGVVGAVGRLILLATVLCLLWLVALVLSPGGVPGTLVTTLFYVVVGVTVQFLIGLGLALLASNITRGRTFYRMAFFLPLMVTPVGIAYSFRMLADLANGPFAPVARGFGYGEFSWASSPWAARFVVLLGDTWQWTPFMFIVLLAAIENQPRDQLEAARLDGASGFQVFRDITWPSIAPIAATVVLIRLIEAFKIIDIPNVLTAGGPGLATESLTLHAFIAWRTQDLGGSAAIGYLLLFVSTVTCVSFFNYVVRWTRRHQ